MGLCATNLICFCWHKTLQLFIFVYAGRERSGRGRALPVGPTSLACASISKLIYRPFNAQLNFLLRLPLPAFHYFLFISPRGCLSFRRSVRAAVSRIVPELKLLSFAFRFIFVDLSLAARRPSVPSRDLYQRAAAEFPTRRVARSPDKGLPRLRGAHRG